VASSNFASQTAKTVLAAPNLIDGIPSFRALIAADIPTLNQNTSGTAAGLSSTLIVGSGGTGATTLTGILKGNGTSPFTAAIAGTDYVIPSTLATYLPLAGGTLTGSLIVAAGTAGFAPVQFNPASAALETTPSAGALEVDANGLAYYSHDNGARGVVDATQFISLTSTYTLTSQTAAQKAFNSTTNGAITVKAGTSYFFEGLISLTAMSTTSGSFGFSLGGTATLTSVSWTSNSVKATATATAATNQMTFNTSASNTTVATASTGTAGYMFVKGIVRINATGTLIPSVSLTRAAAAVVSINSYFRIVPIGTNTITNIGNWN
jgi:hypothetical protein